MTNLSRRAILGGAGAGALAVSGYALFASSGKLPADVSGKFANGEADMLSWSDAFGFTLAPLETPEHFAAWREIWALAEKNGDGARWLASFTDTVSAPPIAQNLRRFEGAIAKMQDDWWSGIRFGRFIDLVYKGITDHPVLLKLVFPDGGFRYGEADPHLLAKWGIASSEEWTPHGELS